jgi:hypothetical protein
MFLVCGFFGVAVVVKYVMWDDCGEARCVV